MNTNDILSLSYEISRIYRSIDRKTKRLQQVASLRCPDGCGACCETQQIEATILETIPIAKAIFEQGEEISVLETVEAQVSQNDFSCVLFRPDTSKVDGGCCTYYTHRPLLCRLFGFASRRNRLSELEFSPCKRMTVASPDGVQRARIGVSAGLRVPVYQESFMRIAALNPTIGFRRRPINLAIKEALEYLYWRQPRNFETAKAV